MSEPTPTAAAPARLPDANDECLRGARLVDDGKLHEAAEVFRALTERQDIGEATRCFMAVNLATVYEKMGHVETAIQTYEYAAGLMVRGFAWIQEQRAKFLFEHNRQDDAVAVWEEILTLPFIADEVSRRTEQNLTTARGRT